MVIEKKYFKRQNYEKDFNYLYLLEKIINEFNL